MSDYVGRSICDHTISAIYKRWVKRSKVPKTSLPATEIVHLVEEKVPMHFSDEENEARVPPLGATNHMTGCRSAFSNLDRSIHDTMKFGDGSVVQIEEMGTILFSCKNCEHHTFLGVYFIPS
jgi:hypothetical protein